MEFLGHLYGQKKLKARLSSLCEDGKLPHTLIFYGDEGLGKTTAAFDLAAFLTGTDLQKDISLWNSEEAEKEFLLVSRSGRVYYIRPIGLGQTLRIDQFRRFLEEMATFDDAVRVCIIDEAQGMRQEIANAILKTLEEPPQNLYFILITHELEALLPTIVSRGARFPFFALSEEEFSALVKARRVEFHLETEEEIRDAFLLSEGNPGLTAEMFAEGGAKQPEAAMDVWDVVTQSRIPFTEGTGLLPKDRTELRRMLRWMMLIAGDLLVQNAAPGKDFARCRGILGREEAILRFWDEDCAEKAIEVLRTAEAACRLNMSLKSIWDTVLIELMRIRKEV